MPELPEVETVAKELGQANISSAKITKVHIYWEKTVASPQFKKNVEGQSVIGFGRRAKYLILNLSKGYLIIHLRMTGRLKIAKKDEKHSPYERVRFDLSNGLELRYMDTRKFGRMWFTEDTEDFFKAIGPEPLSKEFTIPLFQEMLSKKRRQLKPLLLDQKFLAGLGNIYVDEALFLAKLHPLRLASSLNKAEVQQLHHAIQKALLTGLERNGTTLGSGKSNFYRLDGQKGKNASALNVFRRTGKSCPICGHIIERIIVGQRSTHICKHCQS